MYTNISQRKQGCRNFLGWMWCRWWTQQLDLQTSSKSVVRNESKGAVRGRINKRQFDLNHIQSRAEDWRVETAYRPLATWTIMISEQIQSVPRECDLRFICEAKERWRSNNPMGKGDVGWRPMEGTMTKQATRHRGETSYCGDGRTPVELDRPKWRRRHRNGGLPKP